MSSLYRSAISARIAKLPDLPPSLDDFCEGEGDEGEDSLGSLPGGMGPPAMPPQTTRAKFKFKSRTTPPLTPLSASTFFAQALQVSVPATHLDHRVYYTPATGEGNRSVMVFHHGAGYSGLSFACIAKEVADLTKVGVGVLSLDARRHGKTTATVPDSDLSLDVLSNDLLELLSTLFPDPSSNIAPTFILVGHSMGGSVVVRTCPMLQERGYRVGGVVVLDVVEGSALEALPHMHSLLNARPDGFDSVEEAIEWHVSTNAIQNPLSARVSVPSILTPSTSPSPLVPQYIWRTPLRSTAPYWTSWFTGLSSGFLSVRAARLLVLAGTDRLDKELMIGQMMGRFQMEVVSGVGHMLHEDNPTRLAEILVEFWRRNERVGKGVKKVGEL